MMTERIKQFIESQQLLGEEDLCIVALSGGADSVCLLLVLLQLGYRVEAVHCNFKLRGEESNRDELFVEDLCHRLHVPLHKAHFDTQAYAQLHHVSIEMAARQLRYNYFEQLRADLGAQAVCVAHHQDDSVETILMNLVRGTGLRGLTGIKPRQGHVVRPLLCVSRHDIISWLESRGQTYVTDSSNLVPNVVRNKLRLLVMPQLQAISLSAQDNILATARRLAEAQKVLDAAVRQQLAALVEADGIDIARLLCQPSTELLLFEWLTPYGFSPATIEDIAIRLPQAQAGRQWHSASHLLAVHRGRLLLSPLPQPVPVLRIPEPGNYVVGTTRLSLKLLEGRIIKRQNHIASLDADRVAFPLTLRPVEAGDRFHPYGMKGTKLVSDYLTDRHVPPAQKLSQQVLADASGHIVWLVGHRPDAHFCIHDTTVRTLQVSCTSELPIDR